MRVVGQFGTKTLSLSAKVKGLCFSALTIYAIISGASIKQEEEEGEGEDKQARAFLSEAAFASSPFLFFVFCFSLR